MKPLRQPCQVCRDHKPNAPFKIRDDNGSLFKVRFINNCPYCGRFLSENCDEEKSADESGNRRAAPENKPLTLRELGELAEADETVYEANGREWDLYSAPPEIRAKSEHCNIVVDADKIANGFFLYARKPEGSEP